MNENKQHKLNTKKDEGKCGYFYFFYVRVYVYVHMSFEKKMCVCVNTSQEENMYYR